MNYIPHSQIIAIGVITNTSGPVIMIQTANDGAFTTKYFTTDANGITGEFTAY